MATKREWLQVNSLSDALNGRSHRKRGEEGERIRSPGFIHVCDGCNMAFAMRRDRALSYTTGHWFRLYFFWYRGTFSGLEIRTASSHVRCTPPLH